MVEELWESGLQEGRKGVLGIFPSVCPLRVRVCICVWDSVYLCDVLLSSIVCICVCPCVCIHLGALGLGAAGVDTGVSISRTPRLSRAEP